MKAQDLLTLVDEQAKRIIERDAAEIAALRPAADVTDAELDRQDEEAKTAWSFDNVLRSGAEIWSGDQNSLHEELIRRSGEASRLRDLAQTARRDRNEARRRIAELDQRNAYAIVASSEAEYNAIIAKINKGIETLAALDSALPGLGERLAKEEAADAANVSAAAEQLLASAMRRGADAASDKRASGHVKVGEMAAITRDAIRIADEQRAMLLTQDAEWRFEAQALRATHVRGRAQITVLRWEAFIGLGGTIAAEYAAGCRVLMQTPFIPGTNDIAAAKIAASFENVLPPLPTRPDQPSTASPAQDDVAPKASAAA